MSESEMEDAKRRYERLGRRKVTLSFRPDEYRRIVAMTEKDGTFRTWKARDAMGMRVKKKTPAPAVFLRKVVLAFLDEKPVIPETVADELRLLRLEVHRIGTNINQAIKLAHSLKNRKTVFGKPVNIEKELRQTLSNLWLLENRLTGYVQSGKKDENRS